MEILIERRFRGPLASANGGYAAGSLAAFVDAPEVEVTLRLPPPLERRLSVVPAEDGGPDGALHLLDGDAVVAEARPSAVGLEAPAVVSTEEAERAAECHVRMGSELFRECFTCGIRRERDGLGIYAGVVAGREPVHAAPWTAWSASPQVVWAAIDCPGAYAVAAEGRGEAVLGRMTARIDRLPAEGAKCVVVSWPLGENGRKLHAGTALFGRHGEVLAIARQTWIAPRVVSEE